MGRPIPRPRRIDGKIKFAPSDGVFLASRDIMDIIPLRVRIAEVVEYPAGTPRGGIPSKDPILACFLEVVSKKTGQWVRGSKPWAPNTTALWVLYNRFGEDSKWWEGQEITIDLTPRRHPKLGIVAGIYVVPIEDETSEEKLAAKMARALRGECPYQRPDAPEREPGADEGEPPPSDEDEQGEQPCATTKPTNNA